MKEMKCGECFHFEEGYCWMKRSSVEPEWEGCGEGIKRDKSLDSQYVKLLKEAKRLGVGEEKLLDREIAKYEQEENPSDQ